MRHYHRLPACLRLVWAATALVTVWCLGCAAFDPLLHQLAGSGEGAMMCASDGGAPAPTGVATLGSRTGAPTATIAATPTAGSHGNICSCQSCHAAHTAPVDLASAAQPTPRAEGTEPTPPISVARSPLLPPPERSA